MFETEDDAEVNVPAELLGKGQHVWKYVNIRLHVQWFYIMYERAYENGTTSSNFIFLSQEEQIIEMLTVEHFKIIDIYLVSPSHLNGSDIWKMEKLKEIWMATLKKENSKEEGRIYVLQDNCEYTDSLTSMDNKNFIKNKLLITI